MARMTCSFESIYFIRIDWSSPHNIRPHGGWGSFLANCVNRSFLGGRGMYKGLFLVQPVGRQFRAVTGWSMWQLKCGPARRKTKMNESPEHLFFLGICFLLGGLQHAPDTWWEEEETYESSHLSNLNYCWVHFGPGLILQQVELHASSILFFLHQWWYSCPGARFLIRCVLSLHLQFELYIGCQNF